MRIVDWSKLTDWRDDVLDAVLKRFAPERARAWLNTHPVPPYMNTHDWLEPLMNEAGIVELEEFDTEFTLDVTRLFTHLRMVHLCRSTDDASYLTNGLTFLNTDSRNESLVEYLCHHCCAIDESRLRSVIARHERDGDNKNRREVVGLGFDERHMVALCSDFARYGSEYDEMIAASVGLKHLLAKRGNPIAVVVRLPIDELPDNYMKWLPTEIAVAAVCGWRMNRTEAPHKTGGPDLPREVPPEWIEGVHIVTLPQTIEC